MSSLSVVGADTSHILFMKEQVVVTHTVCQIEIPTLLDSWDINTPSVKILYPQKKKNCNAELKRVNNIMCLSLSIKAQSRFFSHL